MKINYVNADHVHSLIDLPTAFSIEKLMQLLKGSSSHWINSNNVISGKFAWGRGYGAFSVSESNVNQVARYIANQKEHHCVRTSRRNSKNLSIVTAYFGRMSKAVETALYFAMQITGLKAGVNGSQLGCR